MLIGLLQLNSRLTIASDEKSLLSFAYDIKTEIWECLNYYLND